MRKRASPPAGRRRWPREQRERFILEGAAAQFAERGFALSTRELARSLGVTQALLYRYFPSKQVLIDRVFEWTFFESWDPAVGEALSERERPLEARLVEFYERFASERLTPNRQILFLRANLDGLDLARRFALALNERVLAPVVSELRHDAGLPDLDACPMSAAERELVMMLHGSIVFLGLRKHVYRTASIGRLDRHVRRHVRAFLAGARSEIRLLHEDA